MRRTNGFTLVELMAVVAIIAILSSVAIPMYTQYTQQGHRSDGISLMESIKAAQQEFYLEEQTYTLTLGAGGLGLSVNSSGQVETNRYLYSVELCDNPVTNNPMPIAQCVEIVGTPRGPQVEDGELRMNTIGLKQRTEVIDGTTIVHEDFM